VGKRRTRYCICDAASAKGRSGYGANSHRLTEVSGPSAEQLVRNLRRNWIGAELKKAELDGRSTGETILATAQSLGCDLLIKGAYTQSRLRQMIFGGATQHVLENAMIPVLLAN
jgi:nucleotide-binding universal stress UspA family protein